MVKTLVRLVLFVVSVVSSSQALELAGAVALVVGASMFSPRAAFIVAGCLLLVKAAEGDLRS